MGGLKKDKFWQQYLSYILSKMKNPNGLVVKNLPVSAGDSGLVSGWGTKVSHGVEQPSPLPQLRPDAAKYIETYF